MCSFEGICERGIHRVMDVFFLCRKLCPTKIEKSDRQNVQPYFVYQIDQTILNVEIRLDLRYNK